MIHRMGGSAAGMWCMQTSIGNDACFSGELRYLGDHAHIVGAIGKEEAEAAMQAHPKIAIFNVLHNIKRWLCFNIGMILKHTVHAFDTATLTCHPNWHTVVAH